LDEALGRVGFREVHKIVGIAMTEQAFKDGLPSYHLSAKAIFENSVATALAMEVLARRAGEDGHEAYTVGLLRQIGKLVLGRILEKEHPGVICAEDGEICAWEREQFNITSHEAAAMVLEAWKLPAEFYLGIRYHHLPEKHTENGPFGALLHLACWVVQMLGYGLKAEAPLWALTPERLTLAGVSEETAQESVMETEVAFNTLRQQLGVV
jgi:HD-like signal output (HDOD) protein